MNTNRTQKAVPLVCWAFMASTSFALAQATQPMSMTNYDAIMGNLQRRMDSAAKPLNDYSLMRMQNALQERARRQQLQDLATQRDFIERQSQLQREHELRLEELRRQPSQTRLTEDEHRKIEKEAYEKARKDLESESLAERRRQAAALVPRAVNQFAAFLTSSDLQLPNGPPAFNSEAVSLVQTDYKAAEKEYPAQAAVIRAHLDAARALIEVSKNLRDFDDNNQTDVWLAKFCSEQEHMIKRGPENQRKINGRTFLSFAEFAEVAKTNSQAASTYWTLSDIQLLERLAVHAHLAAKQKLVDLQTQAVATTSPPTLGTSSETGLLTVNADDDTAEVYVDASFVGNSPAKLKLSEGAHVIEVKKTGFKVYRREIKVTEGAELRIRAALEKQ